MPEILILTRELSLREHRDLRYQLNSETGEHFYEMFITFHVFCDKFYIHWQSAVRIYGINKYDDDDDDDDDIDLTDVGPFNRL
jgi:hypothetical protein